MLSWFQYTCQTIANTLIIKLDPKTNHVQAQVPHNAWEEDSGM